MDQRLIKTLNNETIIWKYLDLSKFLDLLISRKMFLSRSDKFEDQYEGTFSEPTFEEIKELLKNKPDYLSNYKAQRKNIVISSWHANAHESFAMWQIFTKNNEGLAIQSTIGKLQNSVEYQDRAIDLQIGEVNYIDYKKEYIPFTDKYFPYLYKRKSFQYENEVRLIGDATQLNKSVNDGLKIDIDPNHLIERLYIHPRSLNWYKNLVQTIVLRLGYSFEIAKSDLESDILL
ncbi:hypothetical protein K5I29_01140 [Flavobacterium agricola]|uniref:DUF2971 domain-containing protein n=1 Tax=Flavobacterium agricola TaxID=2870839 RepID=A0ABY6LZ11_9FLAO|nr:hypothetical protein [Flavobacterium agricola]UYW01563.1 hypothetical protein K5I29_01140 [Flavobacterium agricola]